MLIAINKENNTIENAKYANKLNIYLCPECKEELILRQGELNTEHFSHKNTSNCGYGVGVSKEHIQTQQLFFDYFKNNNIYCELEKYMGEICNYKQYRRADIYFEYKGDKFIIEVQRSKYDEIEYRQRTETYKNAGYRIIWLGLIKEWNDLFKNKINLSKIYNGNYLLYLYESDINLENLYKEINKDRLRLGKEEQLGDLIDFMFIKDAFYNEVYEQDFYIFQLNKDIENLKEKIEELMNKETHLINSISDLKEKSKILYEKYEFDKNKIQTDTRNFYIQKEKENTILLLETEKKLNILKEKYENFKNEYEVEFNKINPLLKLHNSAMTNTKGYENLLTHKVYDKKNNISYEIINLS